MYLLSRARLDVARSAQYHRIVRFVALSSALLLASCAGTPIGLTVDVISDWVPGLDFVAVDTEISSVPFDGPADGEVRQETYDVAGSENFLSGVRVAELGDMGAGRRFIRVSLRDASGRFVAQRTLDITLTGSFAATVLLTRSCQAVVCPAAAGAPELSECQGGQCVDPRCSPSTPDPELCPTSCEVDTDCAVELEWCEGTVLCRSGGCLCQDSPVSDAGPDTIVPDAGPDGPVCPATETACTDGLDDDCDGMADCADSDCLGASCDDGFFCTNEDKCGADGACSDTVPTCPSFCSEGTASCEECMGDADCGAVTFGAWGACGGFSGTCGESGTRSRPVMTPRCSAGTCTVESTTGSEACSRSTTGVSCGSTTTGSYGGCGGFSNACDTTGTQSRTITTRVCGSGTCQSNMSMESRGCTRTVVNGTVCGGSAWQVCCGGSCTDTRNNNTRCGSCSVNCSNIGRTCGATGTGGYSCRGCTTNAECISELNGSATCWDVAAPPAFCQCQCAANGVCAGGGCGANMFCHDCPGHNFCAPFGGSC